jgi:hypothetical protein
MRARLALLCCLASVAFAGAAELPRGFFVEDWSRKPPQPAFYNLDLNQLQPFVFKKSYEDFIDVVWDRAHATVFFSARQTASDPFRIYKKSWPDGDEQPVYENDMGPFRFLLSPDGERFALQIMGEQAWPTLAVHAWRMNRTTALGQGLSPDWSTDSQRLLFLKIPGTLPSWLWEYRVETDSASLIVDEPVTEAVYMDDPNQIVLKVASHSKKCDEFEVWNQKSKRSFSFCPSALSRRHCALQRDIESFEGHQFFLFQEARSVTEADRSTLVVTDVWGGRLQEVEPDDWLPRAHPVEDTALVVGEDPLAVLRADGTGGRTTIPHAGFIRARK